MEVGGKSIFKLHEGLYRGARPSSFEEVVALPAMVLICLQAGWFEVLHGKRREEAKWAAEAGKLLLTLNLSDFHAPEHWQRAAFFNMIEYGRGKGGVYFHCLHGVDRTGFMAAAYRVLVQGWTKEAAIAEMIDLGFHTFPYSSWIEKL